MSDCGGGAFVCIKCQLSLPVDSFHFRDRAKGTRKTTCKDCQREYFQAHYEANKDRYLARAKVNNRKTVAEQRILVADLRNQPCADCGRTFPPYVMEFDHRSGVEKLGNIADMPKKYYSKKLLAAELEKCDLVCANCHRIRTHKRGTRKPRTKAV